MNKKVLLLLITVIIVIISISFYLYNHHQTIFIHKSLNMINLNKNDYFKNKQHVGSEQHTYQQFQVDLSLVLHKRIFKSDYYSGTITINNENEYKVISTTSHGDINYLVFNNNRDPYNVTNIEFTLLECNQLNSVVIHDVEIDGSTYLLAGPATTVKDAEIKLRKFYPLPDTSTNDTTTIISKKYHE